MDAEGLRRLLRRGDGQKPGMAVAPIAAREVRQTTAPGEDARPVGLRPASIGRGDVVIPFLLHEAIFLGIAFLALKLLPAYAGGAYPTWHTAAPPLIDASWRWDGQWYESIATEGYGIAANGYQNAAFFPLYPVLARALAAPWGMAAVPVAGALVPRLAFLAALVYLYRLALFEHGRDVAGRAVLYVSCYPTALFFSAAYPEALFLLTSVASFYHARRGQWWAAGGWGFLAALTRLQGLLLVIPLALELWQQGVLRRGRQVYYVAALLLVPAGLAAFMLYLQWSVGDPLAFYHAQSGWLRSFALPYETIFRAVQMALAGEADATRQAMGILNTGATLIFVALGLVGLAKQRPCYALYALACLALPLASPVPDMPTVSMARFTAVLFPAFFLLARWGANRHVHHVVLAASLPLFALLTALFVNWYWVV